MEKKFKQARNLGFLPFLHSIKVGRAGGGGLFNLKSENYFRLRWLAPDSCQASGPPL